MNRAKKFLIDAAGQLDLPADILASVPRMEVVGLREFSIEPHNGLLKYEKEQIGIETAVGKICICGTDLTIKLMNKNKITVYGDLRTLYLQEN